MKLTTLCYIEHDGCYLMLHRTKKKNDPNGGKWIGVGGKFEPNETPEECLLREVKEETGLELTAYSLRGIITFISDKWETEYMYLYTADGYTGSFIPCDEGELEWVKKEDIKNLDFWEGDRLFLDIITAESPFFSMKLRYCGEKLAEHTVKFYGN